MAERNMKRGIKVPDKAKPVEKRGRSFSITNEMMRERQVYFSLYFFLLNKSSTRVKNPESYFILRCAVLLFSKVEQMATSIAVLMLCLMKIMMEYLNYWMKISLKLMKFHQSFWRMSLCKR